MALQGHADRLCDVPADPGRLGVRRRGGTSTHGFPRRSAAAPQRRVRQPRGEVYAKGGGAARGRGRIWTNEVDFLARRRVYLFNAVV